MEGQVDSHRWVSKMETRFLRHFLLGKPDPGIDLDTQTANEEPIEAHLLQGGRAGRRGLFLKSQAGRVQRILSKKADSKHGHRSAKSIGAYCFASQLLLELSRFKA